jgi:hypothetical protein
MFNKLLSITVITCFTATAQAFDCPKTPENYQKEISALRSQQKPLNEQLNESTDTATAIVLVNKSIALEERISAVLHRMYECDAIGQSVR